jgi:NADH-quinone oxidoreductase subunit L
VLAGFPLAGIGIRNFYEGWARGQMATLGNGAAATARPEVGVVLGMVVPTILVLAGVTLAFVLYRGRDTDPLHLRVLAKKFYFDELYDDHVVVYVQLFANVWAWIDNWILDGLIIRGAAYVSVGVGEALKLFQTGSLQTYVFLFSLGGGLVIYFALFLH